MEKLKKGGGKIGLILIEAEGGREKGNGMGGEESRKKRTRRIVHFGKSKNGCGEEDHKREFIILINLSNQKLETIKIITRFRCKSEFTIFNKKCFSNIGFELVSPDFFVSRFSFSFQRTFFSF